MSKRYYRYDEVAKELDVSVRTVERWVKNKELEVIKIGGTRRVLADEIEKKTTKGDIYRQNPPLSHKSEL